MEQEVPVTQENFSATFEQAAVGMAHVALDGHFLRVNRKLCSIVGYSKRRLLELTFQNITFPADLDTDLAYVQQLLRGERETYTMEKRYIREDQSVVWINLTVSLVCDEEGSPLYFISVIEDIDVRKQLEEALARERQAFAMVANNAPDIITRFDREFRHLYVNPAVTLATGRKPEEFIGRTNAEMGMPREQVELWDNALNAVLVSGQPESVEFTFSSPTGPRYYQSRLVAERDEQGEIISVLSIARDITDFKRTQEALRRSEARARRLIDSNIIGVVIADIHGILEANDAFLDMLGATREQLEVGMLDWEGLTPPQYRTRDAECVQQLREHGVCTPFEREYMRLDGGRVPVFFGAATLQSQPLQWVCFILNLSSQKRAEQELTRTLETMRTLTDHVPAIITRHDVLTFRYLYVSPAIEQATGLRAQDMLGKTYREVGMVEELCVLFDQSLIRVVQQQQSAQVEYQDHGQYYRSLLVPEWDETGQLSSVLVISHDITDLRQAHQQTAQALHALISVAGVLVQDYEPPANIREKHVRAALLQHLLEVIHSTLLCACAMMYVLDPQGQAIELLLTCGFPEGFDVGLAANSGAAIMGIVGDLFLAQLRAGAAVIVDRDSALYKRLPSPPSMLAPALLVPMQTGSTMIGMLVLYAHESQKLFSEEQKALALAIGSLAALLIEREQLFIAREQAHARELAAEATARQMDAFLGIVSHELKTPITTIKASLQLARRRLLQQLANPPVVSQERVEEIIRFVERAERQIVVQTRLVDDLIDVSRIQADHLKLQIHLCDLVQLTQEVVEDQRLLAPERRIEFTSKIQNVWVRADAQRIAQVVTNYVTNALKYSASDQAVAVEVDVQQSEARVEARVSVRDCGPGLTLEQQHNIWERFYRVPGIAVKSGSGVGLGLGLYVCRTLIERQGGRVGVQSMPGQGSAFWFTLPGWIDHPV